jgi:cytochrome P450
VAAIPRESLRLEQSELLLRVALEDIVFDGYFIPRGSHIRICVWEAHHDPDRHQDPFTFRCERFMDGKVPASLYSPFGLDKHRCLGADWTYELSTLFVVELTRGYAWSITGDGQPVFGKFHFEPSRSFAVELRQRHPKKLRKHDVRCLASSMRSEV